RITHHLSRPTGSRAGRRFWFKQPIALKALLACADVQGMSAGDASSARTSFHIGPDLVTTEEQFVCIDAVREFPEWQVREYARIPIHFQEQSYFLREKRAGQAPFAVRYILERWPANHVSSAPFSFEYNAEMVAQRDVDHREDWRN